jgi:hypothetical protein
MMDFQVSHPIPSAARGSARRHRVEGGRHCVVRVRFTDAELAAVEARAAESKVTMQRYLAGCALSRRPPHLTVAAAPSAVTAELIALRRLTANLANNINQIARRLNFGGTPDASIDAALAAVHRAMDRLDRASCARGSGPMAVAAGACAGAVSGATGRRLGCQRPGAIAAGIRGVRVRAGPAADIGRPAASRRLAEPCPAAGSC